MLGRSVVKRVLLVLLLALVAVGGWLGVRGLQAQRHLASARGELVQAQAALREQQLEAAAQSVDRASADTRRARRLTGDLLWRAAERLPYAGRTLETAGGLAAAADDVARGILPQALSAAEELDPTALRRPDGSVDLALVRRVTPPLQQGAERADAVRDRVDALPDGLVLPRVQEAREELLAQVDRLSTGTRRAAQAAELAPSLLGEGRTRRWFVLIQQPGESRGTGGLPGAYAILEARDGRLKVTEQGPVAALPPPAPAPAPALDRDHVERYGPFGAFFFWVNVNLSPDLPAVTQTIAHNWSSRGRPPLDGVITLDPRSLAALLRGSGPLDAGGGVLLEPADVPEFLAVGQYEGLPAESDQSGRKERLQVIARAAVARLVTSRGDARALIRGVADGVGSGHLRMASLDPALAKQLAEAGVDGALPAGPAPVAYPVVNNFAGGKLDSWLSRRITYTAGSCDGPLRRSRIELRLQSDPPADVPPYVKIDLNVPSLQSLTGRVRASVYATRGASLASASLDGRPLRPGVVEPGQPVLTAASEAGLPLWELILELPPGRERVLVLDLVEPTSPGAARVPEQPLVEDLVRDVRVPACGVDR